MPLQDDVEPIFTLEGFTVKDQWLTIHETDTTTPIVPPERIEENERGQRRWYQMQSLKSLASRYWREEIANELVHKFLLMDKGNRTQYILSDFPPGYYLYTHVQATGRRYDDPRKDHYLFGGGHKFRSPHEAMYHLAWLMSGRQANRCRCVYDNPDKSVRRRQGNLNRALEKEWSQFCDARLKERYNLFHLRHQSGQSYQEPPTPVNVFNEAMFLRPVT